MDISSVTMNTKKNFDFRMSKKVAELTQVVHMLFTRNHEKEVEIEALKEAYEHEISLVIQDAKSRIEKLDVCIRELESSRNAERLQDDLKQECIKREAELLDRIHNLESQLHEEKMESQNSRDLLIQAQKDLESLRQVHVEDIDRMRKDVGNKDREIVKLKSKLASLEQEIKDKESLLDSKGELLRTHEKLRRELDQLKQALQTVEKSKEDMIDKNRHLDSEVKALKKELAKKINERNSAKARVPVANGYPEYNEEIEKLRKELLRYKLELSNRESNFNRMFMDKQPVQVADRARGSARDFGFPQSTMRLAREKTYAGESLGSMFPAEDERIHIREIMSSRSGMSNGSSISTGTQGSRDNASPSRDHLPNLDAKARLHRLVKPRPLPKDMLSAKSGGI